MTLLSISFCITLLGIWFLPTRYTRDFATISTFLLGEFWFQKHLQLFQNNLNYFDFEFQTIIKIPIYFKIRDIINDNKLDLETINIEFGIDGFASIMILLTIFIILLCCVLSYTIKLRIREFLTCLICIEIFLIASFATLNLFFFYFFFESTLIPMFLMVGIWGSRERKIKAAFYLFFYTLAGSLFMLFGILYLNVIVGSLDYLILLNHRFDLEAHTFLFFLFFIPFAVKLPMLPFHIWLPEAHVEAPTIGSIILASLLLKLGSFGLLRYNLPLFWYGSHVFAPFIDLFAVLSVIYASLSTIRQTDLKKIVAYSSIAHMNLMLLGLLSLSKQGIDGSIYLMVGHGFVSSGLFLSVGTLYERYHTRLIPYYGGIIIIAPAIAVFCFIFTMANMGFPGTCNFIGEIGIFAGLFSHNFFLTICSGTGIVLSAVYSIWLYNRVFFGTIKQNYFLRYDKVTLKEQLLLSILAVLTLAFGISGSPIYQSLWYF